MSKSQKKLEAATVDLLLAMGQMVRRLRAESASHELSWTQTAVLARLDREGPKTTADLARAESVKPQSMGITLAFLEERGVVARSAHPTDGRQIVFALTDEGHRVREKTVADKRAWLTKAVAELTPEEQQTLFAATDIIRRLVGS
jgi:DNA-binding MarR family transcriptional regulator